MRNECGLNRNVSESELWDELSFWFWALELSPGTCFPGGAALALALAESLGVTPERPAALLAVAGDHAEAASPAPASPAAARGAAGPTAKALAVGRFVGAAAGWILLGLSQAHAAAAKR